MTTNFNEYGVKQALWTYRGQASGRVDGWTGERVVLRWPDLGGVRWSAARAAGAPECS